MSGVGPHDAVSTPILMGWVRSSALYTAGEQPTAHQEHDESDIPQPLESSKSFFCCSANHPSCVSFTE